MKKGERSWMIQIISPRCANAVILTVTGTIYTNITQIPIFQQDLSPLINDIFSRMKNPGFDSLYIEYFLLGDVLIGINEHCFG